MGKLQHTDKELCETLQSIISSVPPRRSAGPDWVASLHFQFNCGHSVSVKLHNWYYLTSR